MTTTQPVPASGADTLDGAAPTAPPRPGDFAELAAAIKQAGLLRRRCGAYVAKFVVNAGLLAVAVAAFGVLGASWWQLVTATFLAVVSTQLAFIGHDAGHRQIFRTKRANDAVGFLHGGLVGMSYGAWVGKHNEHHAHPNHEDVDPDIDIPVLAFSSAQAATRKGLAAWVVTHQALMFFPLLLLEGWNLHLTAAQVVRRGEVAAPRLEAGLLAAHVLGYLTAVFWVLTPLQAIVFIAVHQGLWGLYMGLAFAPNHKGMPIIAAGSRLDHLHKQVLTSRNVHGGRITDYALGGLNYQIEHHLFPRMPRPNLRHAQPVVRAYCAEHDLGYTQTGAIRSYAQVLAHLHGIGRGRRVLGRNRSPA
jgi:fatty acid desaturase